MLDSVIRYRGDVIFILGSDIYGEMNMSAKLEQAFAKKLVLVRKTITGEVVIRFNNPSLRNVTVSHNGVIDLLSQRGVTVEALRKSNLRELVANRYLSVI